MTRHVLLVLLSLGALVAAPAALAADASVVLDAQACLGNPATVAICEEIRGSFNCFTFWVLGNEVPELAFCF